MGARARPKMRRRRKGTKRAKRGQKTGQPGYPWAPRTARRSAKEQIACQSASDFRQDFARIHSRKVGS